MEKIKVLLADSQAIFREGLAKLLADSPDIEVLSTCSSGFETIQKAMELKPDVILLDMELTNCEYDEAAQHIKEVLPETRFIILAQPHKDLDIPSILRVEAMAYITKKVTLERLIEIIDTVYNKGDLCLAPQIAAKLLETFTLWGKSIEEGQLRYDLGLSKREMEVLNLLAQKGMTNREIASTLYITESTVKTHLSNILAKMHVHNRRQAAVMAREKGIVSKADS